MCVSAYMGVEVHQPATSNPGLEGLGICAAAAGETGMGGL